MADHARDPQAAARQGAADGRGDGQGDEGRPREVHRGRRLGLPVQAGRHRRTCWSVLRGWLCKLNALHARLDRRAGRRRQRPSDEKANILIVDDLPEKLLVFGTVLEELGQNLVLVRSGSEALREVLQREFAVILLDVNMPDIDGFETAALIRQLQALGAHADHLHHRLRRRDADRQAATRSARSTTSCRRWCRRCCAARSRCSSSCTACSGACAGRPTSGSRWLPRRRRAAWPRRTTGARTSCRNASRVLSALARPERRHAATLVELLGAADGVAGAGAASIPTRAADAGHGRGGIAGRDSPRSAAAGCCRRRWRRCCAAPSTSKRRVALQPDGRSRRCSRRRSGSDGRGPLRRRRGGAAGDRRPRRSACCWSRADSATAEQQTRDWSALDELATPRGDRVRERAAVQQPAGRDRRAARRRGRAAAGQPAQGRVPRDAVARAAQPAGADPQRGRGDPPRRAARPEARLGRST